MGDDRGGAGRWVRCLGQVAFIGLMTAFVISAAEQARESRDEAATMACEVASLSARVAALEAAARGHGSPVPADPAAAVR